MTVPAVLHGRYGEIEPLRRTLADVSSVAVGLLFAIARMMPPLRKKREPVSLLLSAVFIAVGLMRWPLPAVLLLSVPLRIGLTIVMRWRGLA